MTRAERRRQERYQSKLEAKTYTYKEMFEIVKASCEDVKQEYDILYSACLATALNAEPIKWGRKRVCRAVELFFGQIDAIHSKELDQETITKSASKLGVHLIKHEDGKFEIIVDPKYKKLIKEEEK